MFPHKYKPTNPHLRNAIEKYGFDVFDSSILQECSSDTELNEQEKYWINFYNSTDPTKGYNFHSGGKVRYMSDEHREALRQANSDPEVVAKRKIKWKETKERNKEKNAEINRLAGIKRIGIKRTPEQVENIRQSKLGITRTKEQIEKWKESRKNYKHSDATKEKISKPVWQIDLSTGIRTYWKSAAEASRILQIQFSGISNCCTGRKKTYKNALWQFA